MLTINVYRNPDGSIDWISVKNPQGDTLSDQATIEGAKRFCERRGWFARVVEVK